MFDSLLLKVSFTKYYSFSIYFPFSPMERKTLDYTIWINHFVKFLNDNIQHQIPLIETDLVSVTLDLIGGAGSWQLKVL